MLLIPFSNNTSQVRVIGVNYPEQMGKNACNEKHEPPFSYLLSPIKQSEIGIPYSETKCLDNLVLVQKYDTLPACVKPESVVKLLERGWINSKIDSNEWTASYYPSKIPLPNGKFDDNLERVILWNMLKELETKNIQNWENDSSIGANTDEGWTNPSKLCSKILLDKDNNKELYVSAAFHTEPELNISEIIIDDLKPTSCQKWFPIPYEIRFEKWSYGL